MIESIAIWALAGVLVCLYYRRLVSMFALETKTVTLIIFLVTVFLWPLVWYWFALCADSAHEKHAPACQYEDHDTNSS